MPSHFLPAKSGLHRVACVSLYRALIRQCSHISIPEVYYRGAIHPLVHLIRKQFRRNVNDTSQHLVRKALKVGYEVRKPNCTEFRVTDIRLLKVEKLFHEAVSGSSTAQSRIIEHLTTLQAKGDATRAQQALNPPKTVIRRPKPAPYPNSLPMLNIRPRPLEAFPGPRKVPKLINANGYPMLRYQKPQSEFLSRVIRDKIKSSIKSVNQRDSLQVQLDDASKEDEWDSNIGQHLNYKTSQDPLWSAALNDRRIYLGTSLRSRNGAQAVRVQSMLNVVDAERHLAESEKKLKKESGRKRCASTQSHRDHPGSR